VLIVVTVKQGVPEKNAQSFAHEPFAIHVLCSNQHKIYVNDFVLKISLKWCFSRWIASC